MKGRKPLPRALHELHGNPSELSAKELAEPVALGTLEAAPEWMTQEQAEAWNYAVGHAPLHVLRAIDRGVLAVWVVAEDTHRKAAMQIEKTGLVIKQGKDRVVPNPYTKVLHQQAMVMIKAAAELGFTPVARARLAGAGIDVPPESPAAQRASARDEFETLLATRPAIPTQH